MTILGNIWWKWVLKKVLVSNAKRFRKTSFALNVKLMQKVKFEPAAAPIQKEEPSSSPVSTSFKTPELTISSPACKRRASVPNNSI